MGNFDEWAQGPSQDLYVRFSLSLWQLYSNKLYSEKNTIGKRAWNGGVKPSYLLYQGSTDMDEKDDHGCSIEVSICSYIYIYMW